MTKKIDVTELPKEQLRKSATWRSKVDACGICTSCKEWTSLLDPCCGSPIYFEGGSSSFEDLWSEIEAELEELAEPDYDARSKDDAIDFGEEK